MTTAQILKKTRQLIALHAGDDRAKWLSTNRLVVAQLQLDQRKTTVDIKRQLLDAKTPCHVCGKPFATRQDARLYQLNLLMHSECHRKYHSKLKSDGIEEAKAIGILTRESKPYEGKPFVYWWDIAPTVAATLDVCESVEFVMKDTGLRCLISPKDLKKFLTPERKTSRGDGNWGIRVLKDREDELAFEPGRGGGKWQFLSVTWLGPEEDN
jgi:hypothetical protein